MTTEFVQADTLLVVMLKREPEQVTEILRILQQIEVPVALPQADTPNREPGTVHLRVPTGRAVEAVLALAYHGFSDVRTYESDSPVA